MTVGTVICVRHGASDAAVVAILIVEDTDVTAVGCSDRQRAG